jgi:serine/threonine protein kinase/tetratricopeptide (TPR) repeat protein
VTTLLCLGSIAAINAQPKANGCNLSALWRSSVSHLPKRRYSPNEPSTTAAIRGHRMNPMTEILIGNRYRLLDKLGEGGMGMVYRAFDRLTRETIALKRLVTPATALPDNDLNTNATRLALANEFQTLASLHHPHIIQVLDYGFDDSRQPYFTMNLLMNPKTLTQAGQGQPRDVKIRLLIETLQALAYLHQRGIVHRDLKPDNALVMEDGSVKVLDFGLAVLREQKQASEEIAGTIAYIAPETLQGGPITTAVDLYALGVMAYELFAGRHPFSESNPSKLIYDILLSEIELDAVDETEDLKTVIGKLLAKLPENRYDSANDVIDDLNRTIAKPIPLQSEAIRESFLQAARFVGREQEIKLLSDALDSATNHHGSAWLIAGESGVGKSRLIDEVRVRALVNGALVLSGQGVAGGGLAYQLWHEPLRRMVLAVDVNDTDAGILDQIVTDTDELLGRTIPKAPELDGQAGQQRLLTTIASLFHQQRQPVVLILEDLQWAEESIEVLESLVPMTPDLALLIVGSYRNDEKPDLPEGLPGMKLIKLDRFSEKGIEQLSLSMLGKAGQEPQVLALLKKETEGNVFFLVEVLRALAEKAGSLDNIGRMTIPQHIFAGGVQSVVQNRLNRMPEKGRPLLKIAAITGRQIDLNLLRPLGKELDLDAWLTDCSNAAVLDVMDGHWRFAHDKLREGLLNSMADEEKRGLHRQVAQAFETVYNETKDEYAAIIADHYEAADAGTQALVWCLRAGKRSFDTYAAVSAINYYRRALELWSHSDEVDPEELVMSRMKVHERLGELLTWQAHYAEAIEAFSALRTNAETSHDVRAEAAAWYGIARTLTYQGEMGSAMESATRAEEIARAAGLSVELVQALWMKGWITFRMGDLSAAESIADQVLLLSQDLQEQSLMANCQNLLGAIHSMLGNYGEAALHFENALDSFGKLGLRANAMSVVNNLGWLAENRGDYQHAFARYQEALGIARDTGHRDAEMVYLSNLGGMRVMMGDYPTAEAELRQVISMAAISGLGVLSETYRNLAEATLRQGAVEDALEAAKHSLKLGHDVQSQEYVAAAWRVLGQVIAQHQQDVVDIEQSDVVGQYNAERCFQESLRIAQETGLDSEKARTLRAWALYEMAAGNLNQATTMWQESREIFEKMGAQLEAERMSEMPVQIPH